MLSEAGKDTSLHSCLSLELNACCGVSYRWSPGYLFEDRYSQNPIVSPKEATTYYLEILDSNGCTSIDSIHVDILRSVFEIPNIFTPNNDGMNELFVIDGACKTYDFKLYNRWGRKVYSNPDYNNGFNGSDLPDGVYYYLINDGLIDYKGWVQILR